MASAVNVEVKTIHRGWRIVGGLLMNLALGTLYAWSVFVAPLEKEYGWGRSQTSRVFTIAVVAFALAFIVAGRLQDRFGPLRVSLIGSVLVSFGYWMCSEIHSLNWLFMWFGVVVGFGTGFGYATPIPVMAKWFPDHRGLAVGLAVAGFGLGSAIFGPLCSKWLVPSYGIEETFRILSGIFLVMTVSGALLLRNPPPGYRPRGWVPPDEETETSATRYDFSPAEILQTRSFYLMWLAYALGTSAGLMVISQLIPFTKEKGISPDHASTAILVGAFGSAAGRALSGWMSDTLGRANVLRLMIMISMFAMPFLYRLGGSTAGLWAMVFIVYWCFGTQLSVNASMAADFWGTKNAGINYGLLYTAYGVAGIIGPWIGSAFYERYHNYENAFTMAGILAAVALVAELLVRRPHQPSTV